MVKTALERPKPTISYVSALCGGNRALVANLCFGASETPLNSLYSRLNDNEAVALLAGSRVLRQDPEFREWARDSSAYEIINRALTDELEVDEFRFKHGYGNAQFWLNHRRKTDEKPSHKKLRAKLNPFTESLRDRLTNISEYEEFMLRSRFVQEPQIYVFRSEFDDNAKGKNRDKTKIMRYQLERPTTAKAIYHRFAKEAHRLLSGYSRELWTPEDKKVVPVSHTTNQTGSKALPEIIVETDYKQQEMFDNKGEPLFIRLH